MSCNSGYFDVDGAAANGCECQDDTASSVCAAATNLGMITTGGSATYSGKVPAVGGSDWFEVAFPGTGGTPSVDFSVNDGTAFRFEVLLDDCANGIAGCGTAPMPGMATGLTSWTFTDNTPGSAFSTRNIAWPARLFIRVYRVSAGASCGGYTLRVTR
jgi:hypothetical protein